MTARSTNHAAPRRPVRRGEIATSAADFLPAHPSSLTAARDAAAACRGCPLWEHATQTVFGEGPRRSRLMLVGEIPGDQEDRAGKPFVGPAGRLLDEALAAARIERTDAYVTNVVKHFKWEPRGRRRLHRTPTASEVAACLPWLELEIALVAPEVLVCLGGTAVHALIGRDVRVSTARGRFAESAWAPRVTATVHPSALLRIRDPDERRRALGELVADLAFARSALAAS